jgi:hypothetical protein
MFSIKPFLKRFVPKHFLKRLVITQDRAFGQAFRRKGCGQAFFEKNCSTWEALPILYILLDRLYTSKPSKKQFYCTKKGEKNESHDHRRFSRKWENDYHTENQQAAQ